MEQLVEDQSVIMEDNESFPPLLTDDERCLNIHALDKEINAFNTRKGYVMGMIDVEKNSYNTSEEIVKKLEAEQLSLEDTLQTLEAPIIRPAKFTAKANKNIKSNDVTKDFVFPKKTAKNNLTQEKNEQLIVNNSFAALNTANNDAEDVTQPQPKIKPIFMKITPDYNLLLQEIHRTHPTAKNTHMKGYFKIEAETEDHHREITAYLTGKSVGYYVINPPENRPLKLVIKGLPEDVEPEDVKKDLISKGINVEKVAQLKKFATKARLPLFLIEITRDDNVNDIYQIRSVLYMQIKLDPFRKSNRVTQCYNCNNFHHASQNCFMKTRCLKCGENHRTGECSIKEKIENPLCINCNTNGHMASSTECLSSLNPERVQGKQLQKTERQDPPSPGRGGTAILIKNFISHYHVPTPPLLTGVEGTLITITPIDYDPILVGSIYIPPINNYFRNLGAALDTIFNFNNKTILVGDFNAKHTSWGCHCSDTRGNRLYNYIVKNSIDVLAPPTPTRFGLNSASIIDYALIKNLNWPCNISSIPELSSDHNPIKLHFPRTSKFELPPPQLNTTWSKFTLNLANTENLYLHKASSTSEIENEVRELTSEILTAHGYASKPVTHSEVPFVQGELKHLFKERNRARKIWQFTRHPQDKTTLNRLQNTIKRKVNLYRQQVWEEHLTSLDTEDGSLWGTAKAFRRKAAPISALNGPTGTALSDTHKTELIAQSLESQFQLNDIQNPHKDEYITNTVDAYFTANTNNTEQIPPALPSEVIFYIKRLKYFPSAWKTAVVVPILKPGKDPTLAESHRPISLLPILSKLAEKIISTRLNDFLETNKILIPEQHGFRPRLSTTHQLLRVVEYIKEGNNMGQCTAAVFLDIQKAFDRVWHTGLLFKLINYNIPTPLILLLNSYISNRSFTVKINRTYSQTRSISAGVAQGSILGPVLFNLYVNDILKSTNTMLCMYADDTAILSRHKNLNTLVENINEHLAHLEIWFSVWKIALNSTKN
ncbi:probable RNA-directed DNA polymerase from transposon X-element [Trichonephila clavipes]|nr:probable RNA-directed DNA polymerase from transposon X-element [Trichonephila clavipes]